MSTQLPASASGAPSAGVDAHDGDDVQLDSAIDAMIDEVTEGQIVSEPPPPRAPIVGGESDADESPLARQGEVLAQRYVIKRLLAKGGMGRVYLATQTPLGREVAVKCLIPQPNDKEFRKRFFLEASTCARLTHRHIVTVHDYGEADNGELFMAMEYLRGEPLSRVIAREGRLSSERTGRIALQIARALRAAHKIGVVHRDLKPGNIMLLRDEDQDVADFIKVLDFGLVKAYSAVDGVELDAGDLTRAGTWLGSPRYMAPEQIRCREVDPRTDIYSLGAIIYHMLAGRPPFTGATSVEIFGQHLRDAVPWIRELSGASEVAPELEVVVRRCLEKEPDRRYQSLDELMADLKAALRLIAGVSAMGEATMGHVLDPAEHSVPPGVPSMTAAPLTRVSFVMTSSDARGISVSVPQALAHTRASVTMQLLTIGSPVRLRVIMPGGPRSGAVPDLLALRLALRNCPGTTFGFDDRPQKAKRPCDESHDHFDTRNRARNVGPHHHDRTCLSRPLEGCRTSPPRSERQHSSSTHGLHHHDQADHQTIHLLRSSERPKSPHHHDQTLVSFVGDIDADTMPTLTNFHTST